MDKTNSTLEMYELDLQELNNFISQSTRPNLKRQLEEYKKILTSQHEEEKKKLVTVKEESPSPATSENTTSTSEVKLNIPLLPITKYAFENGDKFVK
jgi:hypothetical protein